MFLVQVIPLDLAAGRSRGAGDERRRNMKLKQRSEEDQASNIKRQQRKEDEILVTRKVYDSSNII